MSKKEIRKKSKAMLANFVDTIGYNGKFYASTCNCPMAWGEPKADGCGQFMSPDSEELESFLESSKYDEKTKKRLNSRGLILIDENYKQNEADSELFVSVIHEMIHSNRNLLIFDATRKEENEDVVQEEENENTTRKEKREKNEYAYTFVNGKFVQNTTHYEKSYADAGQEILKGTIDTSRKVASNLENMSFKELEDIENSTDVNRGLQMKNQQFVDEALVEIMALVSYKLYSNKEKGESTDIWKILEETRDLLKHLDRYRYASPMCEIILKHHDFELFKWMIDPIEYSHGDIHYDFFGQYTENDQNLVQEVYKLGNLELDRNEQGLLQNLVQNFGILYEEEEDLEADFIDIDDIKEVAISQTAIKELLNSFQDIKNAKNRKITKPEKEEKE